MNQPIRNSPTATTLFCEDLRQEMGSKLSAMGIYQGVMGLPAEEWVLPKLVAWTTVELPQGWPGGALQVRLFDRQDVLTEASFEVPAVPENVEHLTLNVPLTASPFNATVGMVLRVSLVAPGFSHMSSELRIVRQE